MRVYECVRHHTWQTLWPTCSARHGTALLSPVSLPVSQTAAHSCAFCLIKLCRACVYATNGTFAAAHFIFLLPLFAILLYHFYMRCLLGSWAWLKLALNYINISILQSAANCPQYLQAQHFRLAVLTSNIIFNFFFFTLYRLFTSTTFEF